MAVIDRLKVRNFKSFRNANIPLSEGYTTIIGANGSGKSNLVDAICFVLGSSSVKTMRGERLVDLVHTSAKDAKAIVELEILKNGNKHNLVREIDKKGTSVFRLDNKRTTRSHIVEFLSKLNIHPDGHNIIMQGDVSSIIKMTPAQRRTIIDEVSGIAEYESKKDESIKELGKVSEKLKESDIVLSERTAYMKVLEKEKTEAEKYKGLSEQQKILKASISRKELQNAEKAFETNKAFIANSKERIESFKEKEKESQKESDELDQKSKDINDKIFAESNKRQKSVQGEIEKIKSEVAVTEEKLRAQKKTIENNQMKRQALSKEISDIGNKIDSKENALDLLFSELDKVKKQMNEKQSLLDETNKKAGKFDSDIGAKYKKLDSMNDKIEQEKEELHNLNLEVKSLTERYNLKKAATESKDSELTKFREREGEIKKRIENLVGKTQEFESNFKKLQEEFKIKIETRDTITEKLNALDKELVRSTNRMNSLESKISIIKHVTGKGKAVEAIIKNQNLSGIKGALGDLCSFKAEYSTAVNAAAGSKLNYLVTETKDDAINALNYLKKNKLGKASFIPLDSVKPPEESKGKTILDFLKFNEKLKPAFQFVFGNTLLVKKINDSKNFDSDSKVVSFEGDVITKTGLITGGYTKELISLDEIEELDKLKNFVKNGEKDKIKSLKELDKIKQKIEDLHDKKTEAELKLNEARVVFKQWQTRLDEYQDAYNSAIGETKGSEKELTELEGEIHLKKTAKEELENKVNSMISERYKLKKIFENPEVKELNNEINEYTSEIEEIKERHQRLKNQVHEIKTEIEKVLVANRKNLRSQVKEIDDQISERNGTIKDLEEARGSLFKTLKEKEEKMRSLATSMTDLFKEKEDIESRKKTVWQRLGRYTREIQNLVEKIEEKKEETKTLEERYTQLKNAYKTVKDVDIIDRSISALRSELSDIEAKLSNLGYVNMKALEMYDEYKKEVTEIKSKTEKLVEERQSIMNLIDEIESKKLKSFTDTFKALNKNFHKYYREFYPEEGTYATLKLDNKENPLESGLLLEAQPAHKKIKSLESMSGGEKVITALAFLFSIQAYKPSPFYVLDEVDAALDKENSERIARMLKKFSKELQFIIVTHNTNITKASDQIVGVHMQKNGSSAIEVDLKNLAGTTQIE